MRGLAIGPGASSHLAHWQPGPAFEGARQRRLEDLGKHLRVIQRIVWPHLRHAPMRCERLEPQVLDAEVESAREFDRAHGGVDRQFGADQLGLGGQEGVIERHVVGHQGAASEHTDEFVDDVGERRLARQHVGRQPVHVRRPGIDTGIEQAGEAALDVAVVAHRQSSDADDACLPRAETRRLDVDDRPACTGCGGWPTPGVAHVSRMARCADKPGPATPRVAHRLLPS